MLIQISSGNGPDECEFAVKKLYDSLNKEYSITLINSRRGNKLGTYSSILFHTEEDLSNLEGSIQWICKSPFRPNHKRKNWFVDLSIIPEVVNIDKEMNIRYELFHSGGNGGQNVNKVETGVRVIHIPTGITIESTSERSQLLNKKDALAKLNIELYNLEVNEKNKQTNTAWKEHMKIVRGNPVRIYMGMNFKRKV